MADKDPAGKTPDPQAPASDAGAEDSADVGVAMLRGQPVAELPADLYVPPDALVVFLDAFQGPLDFLLYLIRRRDLDLLAVSISEVTEQYMSYIELMQVLKLDLAGEYLLMAATLAEIKARLLLPRQAEDAEDEPDPRAELVRRLRDYQKFQAAAQALDDLPRMERDLHLLRPEKPAFVRQFAEPEVALKEILAALVDALRRAEQVAAHSVSREALSVRERMSDLLARLNAAPGFLPFTGLFVPEEGRAGVVVTFLALMELIREGLAEVSQSKPYAPIHVRGRA